MWERVTEGEVLRRLHAVTEGSCEEIRFDVGASRLLTRAVLTGNDLQYRDRKEAGRSSISSQLQAG